ncbi:MAG: glycoside hydrolase family 9 protein, partial [Clostridiales bacterium]|nr:glycoside hydrolase family 9 protein [Clostridiales bacterium]
MKRILTNHAGYDSLSSKKAVLQSDEPVSAQSFCIVEEKTGAAVYRGAALKSAPVARWGKGDFWLLDFSDFCPNADKNYSPFYTIAVDTGAGRVASAPFEVYGAVIAYSTLSAAICYFKSQRATGEWEAKDRSVGFDGPREGVVDVHGGWFDATGDAGVHMTHQSHTTYFNPQQASFSAYVLYRLLDLLDENKNECYSILRRRVMDEASYGADWLMRARAPSAAFFKCGPGRQNAFDPTDHTRRIGFEYKSSSAQFGAAATAGQEAVGDENYETSFRAGGGYAIAALAAAARRPYPGCAHSGHEYLKAASDSYFHLEANNERYANDGAWNLVDEYCALDALTELYKSSREAGFLNRARDMAASVIQKYVQVSGKSGYLSVNGTDRPYFSASDEGGPVVALLNYCGIEPDEGRREKALGTAEKLMAFALDITNEASNVFGYARIFFQDRDGRRGKQFFFPHNTEMAPWWQGDNARILSLSAAARYTAWLTKDKALAARLGVYADDQIAWVLGCNPYDSCMMEGVGRHS